MDSELKIYRSVAENLYGQLSPADGVSPDEIERAESSYDFRLPKVLREFYLLAGNHEAINESHNYLLSVDCLETESEKLIFYQENQGVCYWGIDLADIAAIDPPVWVGQSIVGQEALDWHLDADNLSDFLLVMLCWQSVMGGLSVTGIANRVDETVVRALKDNFSLLETGKIYPGFRVYIGPGKVVCWSENKEGSSLYAGASDEGKFLEIEGLLRADWDYCSLDD